ncbi:MAG: FG-GAP repeat protein [Planctomycetota bacterium]
MFATPLLSLVVAALVTAPQTATSVQDAYVKASNTGSTDYFGFAIAMSGDTLVVGTPLEDSDATGVDGDETNDDAPESGAVYVYVRSGSTWVQQAYLKPSNTGFGDGFGCSVAIDHDTLVVGAWTEDSRATGVDGNEADNTASGAGAAYVFVRNGTTWTQQAYLKASNTDPGDQFGSEVDISGDTIVVAAWHEQSKSSGVGGNEADNSLNRAGAVYVFRRSGTTWSQEAYLKAAVPGKGDWFGTSLSLDGDRLAVGAYHEDSRHTGVGASPYDELMHDAGAVYVFERVGTTWSQDVYIKASNTGKEDTFGVDLDLSGNTLVVGAPGESSAASGVGGNQDDDSKQASGAVYVFVHDGTSWSQQAYLKASNPDAVDQFGSEVAIDGDLLVVTAPYEGGGSSGIDGNQGNVVNQAGAAYLFERHGSTWVQRHYVKPSNPGPLDLFGYSVAIEGLTYAIAAVGEDSDATGVGGNQASNAASFAGAVYVFTDSPDWRVLAGCGSNTATWFEPAAPASLGTNVTPALLGSLVQHGVAATYFGARGTDAYGCGTPIAGGELLLALSPAPTALGISIVFAGISPVPLSVPNVAGLVGIRVTLQSALVDTTTFASEISKGLEFEIRP